MNKNELMVKIGEIFDKYDPNHKLSMVVTNKITNDIVDLIIMNKNFSDKLNKNIEAIKKKIPSMNVKDLVSTWLSGYHPECLSLALQKIVENEDKYPKLADLYYKLQDELTKLSGVKINFSDRIKKCFSFIYHVRLTDRNDKNKSVSIDNLEAGSWQEAVDKVISEHPEFGLKPGDYKGSDEVEVHWNYSGKTLHS